MKPLILSSPAKLNLALQVIGKRPDGYHNLKTLFERIDLADRLSFAPDPTGKIRIQCAHPHVPIGPKNLVYRVARLLQERYRVKAGVTVRIDKRIPVAAGLAGGSSNAATALLGLNRLWGLGLSPARLVRLAKTIGCDVPFFLHDCSWALGQERGDRIRRLDIPVRLWHVLVVPRVKMYSQEVFTALNLQLTKRSDNVNILIRSLKNNNIIGLGDWLANDLEDSIVRICPRLKHVKDRIQTFNVRGVSFSGSGPSIFGLTASRQEAETIRDRLSRRYSQVYAVRTL